MGAVTLAKTLAVVAVLSIPGMGQAADVARPESAAVAPLGQAMDQALERLSPQALAAMRTGNPDQDFAALDVALRLTLIDLARAEFRFGSDSSLRKSTGKTIAEEEKRIRELVEWQRKNPLK